MTFKESCICIGLLVVFALYMRHEKRISPVWITLRVNTDGKNKPDLIIGISKIVEQYDKTVIDERVLVTNPKSCNYRKLCVRISTIKRYKDDIIKDVTQYMTQGFAYLSYEIKS